MTGEARDDVDRRFEHVILTRFNVRFPGVDAMGDDWLAYRWAFFRDALASAMSRQTVRDFRWLVFFDIDTPQWLRDETDGLSEGLFEPTCVIGWSPEVAQRAVADATEASAAPYLITTRIDSDDAVASTFIADVQSHFDAQASLYINLLCGVQVERTGELYRYDEPSNPFISYVEKRMHGQAPRTVFFSLRHGWSRHHADLLNVVGPPRWMQIIHGVNLANGVRGLRVRPEPFEAAFDFELPFDRTVPTARYRRERLRSLVDLARLWVLYPRFAREYAVTRRLRRAGTQVLPKIATPPRLRTHPAWLKRIGAPIRRAIRESDAALRRRRNRQKS